MTRMNCTKNKYERILNPKLEEIKVENPDLKCLFCDKSEINEVEWGMMYKLDKVVVHYFCILFSSSLEQNGQDDEGIWGFLPKDIMKELKRGYTLKCKFCKKKRATIGCGKKSCQISFHFTCGVSRGTRHEFRNSYESYCAKHKPELVIPKPRSKWVCNICKDNVIEEMNPLCPPCCSKRIYDRLCLQQMALHAGWYHLKCPCCKDKDGFHQYLQDHGVFIPFRDASWELDGEAFVDLEQLYSHCDAEFCMCPQGRDYCCTENPAWKIIRCGACGAQGIHKNCGGLKLQKWKCPGCLVVLRKGKTRISYDAPSSAAESFDEDAGEANSDLENSIKDNLTAISTAGTVASSKAVARSPQSEQGRPNCVLYDLWKDDSETDSDTDSECEVEIVHIPDISPPKEVAMPSLPAVAVNPTREDVVSINCANVIGPTSEIPARMNDCESEANNESVGVSTVPVPVVGVEDSSTECEVQVIEVSKVCKFKYHKSIQRPFREGNPKMASTLSEPIDEVGCITVDDGLQILDEYITPMQQRKRMRRKKRRLALLPNTTIRSRENRSLGEAIRKPYVITLEDSDIEMISDTD